MCAVCVVVLHYEVMECGAYLVPCVLNVWSHVCCDVLYCNVTCCDVLGVAGAGV